MPNYYSNYDCKTYRINKHMGNSYKASVMNKALDDGEFRVSRDMNPGELTVLYRCAYGNYGKGHWVSEAGIDGDHVIGQEYGRSSDPEARRLYAEAQSSGENLTVSCSTCNRARSNFNGRVTRMRMDDHMRNRGGYFAQETDQGGVCSKLYNFITGRWC